MRRKALSLDILVAPDQFEHMAPDSSGSDGQAFLERKLASGKETAPVENRKIVRFFDQFPLRFLLNVTKEDLRYLLTESISKEYARNGSSSNAGLEG